MLDLYAEVFPLWKMTDSFYGAPFIYCMLHNFGGSIEMYGDLESVSQGPAEAIAANTGISGQFFHCYLLIYIQNMSLSIALKPIPAAAMEWSTAER